MTTLTSNPTPSGVAPANMRTMRGTIQSKSYGDVRLHTYISPEDGLLTNTPIVEGPDCLVIFDGQFFLPYAREAALFAESLGKPVERIVLSHIHLDHWAGLGTLKEHFPEARIWAPAGVAEYLRANGQRILDERQRTFGDLLPRVPTIPTEVLPEGRVAMGGVDFDISVFADAESALQMIAIMPGQRTLLAFDLAFAASDHVFTCTAHFDNWMGILKGLDAQTNYDTVVSGHGTLTDRSAIAATIEYLAAGKQAYAAVGMPHLYVEHMKQAFSGRQHPGWIEIGSTLLYNEIGAYAARA